MSIELLDSICGFFFVGFVNESAKSAAGTAELEADAESLGSKAAAMPLLMNNMHALGPTSDSAIADVKASQVLS